MKKLVRKSPFLLMEVMIGLSLILLCSVFLFSLPASKVKKGIETIKEIELERYSELAWQEIILGLQKNFNWEELGLRKGKSSQRTLSPLQLSLQGITANYSRTYRVYAKRNRSSKQADYRLIRCEIMFREGKKKPRVFTHNLLIKKEKDS